MRSKLLKTAAVASLLVASGVSFAQQQVNLTAGPTGITLPDGNGVPMWGYTCGAIVAGSGATCAPLSGPSSPAATGALGAVAVLNGGSGYTSSPSVTISAPTGTFANPFNGQVVTPATAQATAVVANGQVVGISLTSAGAGYTAAPSVTIAAPTSGTAATATAGPAWSPVVITVPIGASGGLQINLTNNLTFTPSGAATPNNIPTSIMIVGQVGGGLGNVAQRTTTMSPDHSNAQSTYTWPTANLSGTGAPPLQGSRVQSFGTEVEPVAAGTAPTCVSTGPAAGCAALTWSLPRAGTYLLESGTHPSIQAPMGLIGMLVVTTVPAGGTSGTAYPAVPAAAIPAVQYSGELPLEFSEIDPVQNNNVNIAVNTSGFNETTVWTAGSTGPLVSVNIVQGGSCYSSGTTAAVIGAGGSGAALTVTATARTIDPVTLACTGGGVITGYTLTSNGTGYSATAPANVVLTDPAGTGAGAILKGVTKAAVTGCGAATIHTCYPPAVNYTPFYYLINGVAFNKTNTGASQFPATAGVAGTPPAPVTTGISGPVLVRLVNAGLRMHVPSIVGSQTTGWVVTGGTTPTATTGTVGGFTLIAEDGNPVPGPLLSGGGTLPAPRVQTDVFMAAGKTFDVMIATPSSTTAPALPIYDRELSLSANASERDAGMLAYISVNGAGLPVFGAAVAGSAAVMPDIYNSVVACPSTATSCTPVVVSSVGKGVIANDSFVNGVQLLVGPTGGTLTCNATPGSPAPGLCSNGTFTYTPNPGTTTDSFWYCANGAAAKTPLPTTLPSTDGGLCASVTLGAAPASAAISVNGTSYTATAAGYINIAPPGVLAFDKDPGGFPLSVVTSGTGAPTTTCTSLSLQPNGGFIATAPGLGSCTFTYTATNTQGSTGTATVGITFPTASGLQVKVLDGQAYKNCQGSATCIAALPTISDYRWLIEEDKTFYVNPACTTTTSSATPIAGCPTFGSGAVSVPLTFGVNFHTSHMDYVAQGCTGTAPTDRSCEEGQSVLGVPAVCEAGNGVCDTTRTQQPALTPSQVALDPGCGFGTFAGRNCGTPARSAPYPKRYYISVLPGDAGTPFGVGYAGPPDCSKTDGTTSSPSGVAAGQCGHGMGGAPISWNPSLNGGAGGWNPVIVLSEPSPYPPSKLSVQVFEDDFPLNGEQDAGGGVDVIATNEPGLGGFEIILWDDMGASGDVTGQMTHDMFNQPLSNSLAGTIDPATGLDACPISPEITANTQSGDGSLQGLTGRIVTCPRYESNGTTLSPLAGQALVANLMPGRFSVQAYPGADRIARGEEWLQTNTLDGQHPHDSFLRIGEPSYFQEYGPAGFHVSIGFANPKTINDRHDGVCSGSDLNLSASNCTNTVTGRVTSERMSRPPDERLYSSGSRDAFYWTQCFVSLGDPDGEDFMFTKCDANGNFTFTKVPSGSWRLSVFDQWNDQLMDGLSTPINVASGNNQTVNMGDVAVQQWQSNVYTRTFVDDNKTGVYASGELGIPFLNTTVRYRDGALANNLVTDFNGIANFNETFPLFNWYVIETDNTRYKTTGIHTVYDAGGPADGTTCGSGFPACGPGNTPYSYLANTVDPYPLPANLSVPGAIYCTAATCTGSGESIATGTPKPSGATASTGRIDPPWVFAEGWQGFSGQNNFIEFGKTPYAATENGGIRGHVIYASTRPFDDPQMLVQTQWEPLVPHVIINLYQEGFASDGVTPTLTLVDSTQTSSWDDWAQGFRSDGNPNMNCPGQAPAPTTSSPGDLFFYTLYNQPDYLDVYNSYYNNGTVHTLPYNSQYKCYDAMHNWNQVQPAPYDGVYQFPSVLAIAATTSNGTALQNSIAGKQASSGTAVTGWHQLFAPGATTPAGNYFATNCTICTTNPDTSDPWRVGTPMLPPGKYVVEIVLPNGYELVKEEDKNILIGDNFIAPVSQQFGGLANIFILPDQASVASLYDPSAAGYNANSAQNPTQSFAMAPRNDFVPAFLEPVWPCVGQARTVPDYISLFPESSEVAPFAGATRKLCDRKEVTLGNQMGATAKFYIYTSTHITGKFAGVITDDFTSEFDPFAPVFGEKFSPPNMPVSVRDWAGNETQRIYSDQWGAYNGLTYSTWEVNPPNPTGYSPTMMVQCMNDAGPAIDFRPTITNSAGATVANPNYGKMVAQDPLFNPLYSQFCYELPYMPGTTDYLDTPVVPTAAMVGAGYNNPDCAYPTETPAVSEVDGDGIGPWVGSGNGHTITISALGDQVVNNYGYAGPQATTAPYNQKTVTRHYGFGTRCTAISSTCTAVSSVTIGGVSAPITSWSDTQIKVTAPTVLGISTVPACPIQQQAQYRPGFLGTTRCGELVITAGNGRQSVDSVTVTVGGKPPTHVTASQSIQAAIDKAAPGDLIIVDPTTQATATAPAVGAIHRELVLMWKPVRLQGVAAASSVIDASTHPAGTLKLDPWRASVNCLFGLALNGQPNTGGNFDSSGTYSCPTPSSPTASGPGPDGNTWNYFYGGPNFPTMVVDRIPLEGILGWDATVNGNLAEQLQEPSLMGAYEGAAITVLAKGVNIPAGSTDVFGAGAEAAFPTGSTLLTGLYSPGSALLSMLVGDLNPICHTSFTNMTNRYPSNFICNPSSIDGMGVTDASQGGGGIFVHAWGHFLQIANNRVYNNAGTLSGGISLGQGEAPEAYLNGTAGDTDPGSCFTPFPGFPTDPALPLNTQLPYCLNVNVNLHHNAITQNSSTGDELFTGTPAGAGGVSICTGADYYQFNYNWICGNLSTGDGGGVGHIGFSWNGDIEHNTFQFNQATNPSIQANGGGLIVMGAAPDQNAVFGSNGNVAECGSVTDIDCVPGLSDGIGPGLVINANLFEGNSADAGSGGALRFQAVNGTDIARFPNPVTGLGSRFNPANCQSQYTSGGAMNCNWYVVRVTNNIINDNVAGWDGAGVSLEDALVVILTNNTISSNDTTASSGVLFNTLGAPEASSQSPGPICKAQNGGTASCPQPAGLVSMQNSPQLISSYVPPPPALPITITCPPGSYAPGTSPTNGTCTNISYPGLYNNLFWQNRSFQVGVMTNANGTPSGTGNLNQQNVVGLFNAAFNGTLGTPAATQPSTGFCPAGSSYWDIGVRNDTGPRNHNSTYILNPLHGTLTDNTGYSSTNLTNPALVGQYCNGSRVPPEATCLDSAGQKIFCGWQVPPGIADAVVPNPVFSLTPAATVDEGNNWINISWGPLSMLNPVTSTGTTNVVLGNYSLTGTSPGINAITCLTVTGGVCTEQLNSGTPVSGVTTIQAPSTDFFNHSRPDTGTHIDVGAVEVSGH
jgi:hypothetical protein